jgi:hypothetical protein
MNDVAAKVRQRWRSFWFRPEPPLALGICRIVLYGMFILWIAPADFAVCVPMSKIYWHPISFFMLLNPHGPPSAKWLHGMQSVWKVSLITSFLGLRTRVSTVVACLLGVYLVGLPYNLGQVNHDTAVACIGLAVMALSQCGRFWSLYQLIAHFRGRPFAGTPSAEYRWPIQLMRVVICSVFFGAGLNKLRTSGLGWVTSETLQMNLMQFPTPTGLWLLHYPRLCHLVAAFTIIVEFLHPVSLLSGRLALFWVPAGISLLVGIYLTMDIWFLPLIVAHVFWVPWNFIFARQLCAAKTSSRDRNR